MSLFEPLETNTGKASGGVAPAVRRAAMLEHPTLAAASVRKGRICETNAPWNALFAVPADVSVESHVATLFPSTVGADRFERGLHAEVATADRSACSVRVEHLLMRRDGTAFVAEIVIRLFDVADPEHPLDGDAVWQVRDITVERTLRRELRDLEDYHRELSRHQWDMTFVIDRKGRISYASSSIESALGYRVQTMLGKPFASMLDPAHAATAEQWLRAASRRGHDRLADDAFPLRVLHRDGGVRELACRPRDCFEVPRIAGLVIHARDIGRSGDDVAAQGRIASRRSALLGLARVAAPSIDARVDAVLRTVRDGVDAAFVTFWPADGDSSASMRTAHVAEDASEADGRAVEIRPPALSDAALAGGRGTIDFDGGLAGPRDGPIELPVLDDGRRIGWLAAVASPARRWTADEIDFVVAGALAVAHAESARKAPGPSPGSDLAVDPLTGLPTRAAAVRHLGTFLQRRAAHERLVAFVVDLDRLRDVNDGAGLDAGDAVLARSAAVLLAIAGSTHYVARIDGDEFLMAVRDAKSSEVDALAETIVRGIAEAGGDGADAVPIDASVGVSCVMDEGTDAEALLLQAESAVREAKQRGGGQAFVFNRPLADVVRVRRALDEEVERALAQDEFTIFYQPQVALAGGGVVALEALLRWRHPTRGLLLPEAFIESVFRRGLIDAVTKFVLVQVCEQVAAWKRAAMRIELPVAVNVSGRRFHDRRLPALVASALLRNGLPARSLVLEITEQNLAGEDAQIERVVRELSRLGVRIAVGGFNAGYAASRFLRQLQVSQVKLDAGFVEGLPDHAESAIVVAAFVDLARRLKYQVVAEGIETRAQFEHLRALGCAVGQGFHLGAPMPVDELETWVAGNRRDPIR